MSDDIVARLRQSHRVGCDCVGCEAADEIERLRAESDGYLHAVEGLEAAAAEIEQLRKQRDGYLEGNRQTLAALAEANEIAKRYKAERDEARRWICQLLANPTSAEGLASPCRGTPRDYAGEQGWDCFKEKP